MASCILYRNTDQTVTVLDIPKSIEIAQGLYAGEETRRRLLSSKAIEEAFPSIQPKSAKALRNVEQASVKSVLLQKFIEFVLEEVQGAFKGAWCSPRLVQPQAVKRQARDLLQDDTRDGSTKKLLPESYKTQPTSASPNENLSHAIKDLAPGLFYHNVRNATTRIQVGSEPSLVYIPRQSSFLLGDVENTTDIFDSAAPQFHLVIMDPPWPNRSARRKQSYRLSSDTADVAALLSSVPLTGHLAEDALVGIWVTNKPVLHDLILGLNGVFEKWGLEFLEEWVWLKVTSAGEPICALDGAWRKPYEILLVGRKRASAAVDASPEFKRRVIIGVPDLHSRKPNLKALFEPLLPPSYEALEVFARNLTAGWWAWGNEVLKFQSEEHWLDSSSNVLPDVNP